VIFNTAKILPPERNYFWPHPVSIHFLNPIPAGENDTPEILKEKTYKIMWNILRGMRFEKTDRG
jgi:hypothetical protein